MGVTGHARGGGPMLSTDIGAELSARELAARQHYVTPTPAGVGDNPQKTFANATPYDQRDIPYYYNNYNGLPVPYSAPSAQKENFMLRSAIRDAADAEIIERRAAGHGSGVVRTDPITDGEVAYLKSMKDQAELAKFDDYVESFIDPRMPGNMKWLMEVYPDYVERRLQQAHTDYEFALKNQMIDCWGINTFEDLHFKYLVDQGKISGPRLQNGRPPVDATYTPGWLSPYNFQSPHKDSSYMNLPFASAQFGKRPSRDRPRDWTIDRTTRPLGNGNTEQQLARGMYAQDASTTMPVTYASNPGPAFPPPVGA